MSQPSEEFLNDLQLFDVMFNEFNNKASSSSYLPCLPIDCNNDNYCFSNEQDDKEIIKAVEEYENKTPIIEKTETVNLSPNPDVKREVQIGLTLDQDERTELINLLIVFIDVFAWSYKDMPGISRDIAQHTIPLIPGMKPVKQKLSHMKPDMALKIKEEIN